jgi:hypothetical protein
VESFNPYAEEFTFVPDVEVPEVPPGDKVEIQLNKQMMEDFHYKQYLAVYSCLSGAVDALVDTINSFECVVSYPTLNEMTPYFLDDGEHKETTND